MSIFQIIYLVTYIKQLGTLRELNIPLQAYLTTCSKIINKSS